MTRRKEGDLNDVQRVNQKVVVEYHDDEKNAEDKAVATDKPTTARQLLN